MIGSRTPEGTRRRGRRLGVTAACAVLVVASAGCARGRQLGGPDGSQSAARLDTAWAGLSCSASQSTPEPLAPSAPPSPEPLAPSAPPSPEPLAADFVPVSASRCTVAMKTVAGDGEWQMRDEQQAAGPFEALVRALRAPSERGGGQLRCPAMAMAPIVIALTDAHGRTTTPAVPHDACGFPTRAVRQAIEALPWKTVKETRINQTRSQLEIDSGCPGGYKPVIAMQAAAISSRVAGTGPLFPGTPPTALQVCRYTLDPTSTIGLIGSGAFAIGRLTTATKLTGVPLARLVAGLNAAPPATAHCDQTQAPFAVLPGSWLVIETGGCNRATGAAGGLRQVDPATAAILAG
jgi:hypothetical protein